MVFRIPWNESDQLVNGGWARTQLRDTPPAPTITLLSTQKLPAGIGLDKSVITSVR